MKSIYAMLFCAFAALESQAYNVKPQALGAMRAQENLAGVTPPSVSPAYSAPAKAETVQRPWFYAIRTYGATASTEALVKFRAGFTPTPEDVCALPSTASAYAGTLVADDNYVYADWTINSMGSISAVNWTALDPATGKGNTRPLSVANVVSMDMTYDATTSTIYGMSAMADYLTAVDAVTAETKAVAATLPFYTLSCDMAGSLYGITIDSEGNAALHSVNKLTGNTVKIGDTGVKVYTQSGYSVYQSAEFSPADGNLYWATVSPEGNGVLYRIDVTTGRAAYLAVFPDSEGFSGMAAMPLTADPGAPAAVANVKAEGAAGGRLEATISFSAPDKCADGSALTQIEEVNIYRGNDTETVKTFLSPAPGAALSWTDTQAVQGFNSYRIVVVNDEGESVPVFASAYCGVDYPGAPSAVAISLDADGRPIITWQAPVKGINGLAMEASGLKYNVIRNLSGSDEVIAEGISECSYTDAGIADGSQEYPYYSICAVSAAGEGLPSAVVGTYVGSPYPLPFVETFNDCALSSRPWLSSSLALGGAWELNYVSTFPGTGPVADSGMLVFPCFNFVKGAEGRITTPMLSFEGVDNPEMTFYFYYLNMEADDLLFDDAMQVEVSTDRGKTFVPVRDGIFYQKDANSRWTEEHLSLKDYAGEPCVVLGFRGISDGGFNILLDDITIAAGKPAGIGEAEISSEDTVEYYNLQGIRMDASCNLTPGIYIRRTAAGCKKVLVR